MTLVSIVGDFHSNILPLFYHFKDEIKNHIIIYDDFKHDTLQAQKLILGTKQFIEQNNLDIQTFTKQIDEDDYKGLKSLSEYILGFKDEENGVLINITDGLANITFTLTNELREEGVKFLAYDRFDNTYSSLHTEGMSVPMAVTSMSIEEHFLLKNVRISARGSIEPALEHEEEIRELFEEHDGVKWQQNSQNDFIQKTQSGFLFEYYVYNLVKNLEYDDIALGIKVEDIYSNTAFENEFDILIMKNNHLHMIECKARDDYSEESVSSFIYKLDSVRSTLDEDANMIFLTQESVYDPFMDGTIKNHVSPYYRANARRIFLRGSPVGRVERFLRDVDSIFALNSPNIDTLAPKEKLPLTDRSKQQEIINTHLQELFDLEIDFFNRTSLAKVFNYKVHYLTHKKVYQAMTMREITLLLRRINRRKDETETHMIYNYFMTNILEKESV